MSSKIFMKFGDIKGDVTLASHAGWVELESFHLTSARPVSQETGRENRSISSPSFRPISVIKKMNLSSQQIFTECVSGHGSPCEIHFIGGGDKPSSFMTYKLENAVLLNYSMLHNSRTNEPKEHFEISYTRIDSVYTPTDAKGIKGSPRTSGYDISRAKNA